MVSCESERVGRVGMSGEVSNMRARKDPDVTKTD